MTTESRYVGDVSMRKLPPISPLTDVPLMTLEEALAHGGLKHNDGMAEYALDYAEEYVADHPGFDMDEACSLSLYSLEYPSRKGSFYFIINHLLHEERDKLEPHLPTLKLISNAVSHLPVCVSGVGQVSDHVCIRESPDGVCVRAGSVAWCGAASTKTSATST